MTARTRSGSTSTEVTMTRNEIAAAFLRAEYGPSVTDEVIAETVSELSRAELDAIVAAVEAQPHLID